MVIPDSDIVKIPLFIVKDLFSGSDSQWPGAGSSSHSWVLETFNVPLFLSPVKVYVPFVSGSFSVFESSTVPVLSLM